MAEWIGSVWQTYQIIIIITYVLLLLLFIINY